jgi:hypothetical protein
VMRAEYIVMTPKQSNNPLNGKDQTHQSWKKARQVKSKVKNCSSFSLTFRGLSTKN